MKTSKQLSEEVFEKIAKKEARIATLRKRLTVTLVPIVAVAFVLPLSALFIKPQKSDRNAPLEAPYSSEQPSGTDEGVPADFFALPKGGAHGFETVLLS